MSATQRFSPDAIQKIDDALHEALRHVDDIEWGSWLLRCIEFHFERASYTPKNQFSWHLHKEIQLEVPLRGGEFEFAFKGSRTLTIKTGEVLIIPPDKIHRWKCSRAGMMLGISFTIIPTATSVAVPISSVLNADVIRPALLGDLIDVFLRDLHGPKRKEMSSEELSCWIYLIIAQIFRGGMPVSSPVDTKTPDHAPRSRRVVSNMIRFIDANIDGDLSIRRFKEVIGLSERQIHRVFLEVIGQSCHSYIMQRRLERARSLLQANPSLSMKEVAFRCGFASAARFSENFKRAFGVSPNEYQP